MMMRRPLVVMSGGVLPCTKAWQSPALATSSCRQLWWWWSCCSPPPPPQRPFSSTARSLRQKEKKQSDALRILFCGSDEFSSASLRALHQEKERNPGLIESIDVVVRPGKPVGRGLKSIRHPPIRAVAEKLGLPIHERDTFTKWEMPSAINLIIAVSFGKLVPERLLRAAKYGGLNVHPSLLPNLRGPAPLHHALLRRLDATGVSLQTLHPHEFDRGLVLAQSRDDELVRIPPLCTVPQLLELVTPVGADMLVQGLRDGLHVPPLEEQATIATTTASSTTIFHAPKIETRDRDLHNFAYFRTGEAGKDAKHMTVELLRHSHLAAAGPIDSIALAQRVIGPLWFRALDPKTGNAKRIIIAKADDDLVIKDMPDCFTIGIPSSSGTSFADTILLAPDPQLEKEGRPANIGCLWYFLEEGDDNIYLFDGPFSDKCVQSRQLRCLRVASLKVDGQAAKPAKQVLDHIKKL